MPFAIRVDTDFRWQEVANLFIAVGWGSDYDELSIRRSVEAYPHVAHARDSYGNLVGYVSAFSDGFFSTKLGELAVHPAVQRHGIGRSLLTTVEQRFPNIPITVKAFGNAKKFFDACGYREASSDVTSMFKKGVSH